MSLPAFYLPAKDWDNKPLQLTGDEAHHANVLRLGDNEKIIVLDGQGSSAVCRITKTAKNRLTLEPERQWQVPRPDKRAIVAIALSKAVRRGFFLEKAAEFGAWAVWLWQAERSQGKLDDKICAGAAAQLRAGAKQCHNPWFPQLQSFANAEQLAHAAQNANWRILPWEEKSGQAIICQSELARPGDTIFVIGPEGGMTDKEVGIFKNHDFTPVSLGCRVLRCETAATFCLGLHWWAAQTDESSCQAGGAK